MDIKETPRSLPARKLPERRQLHTNIACNTNDEDITSRNSNITEPKNQSLKEVFTVETDQKSIMENNEPKPKKKKRRKPAKVEFEEELQDVLDDVEEMKDNWKFQQLNPSAFTEIRSPDNNHLYVEKKERFVTMSKDLVIAKRNIEKKKRKERENIKNNMTIFAISTHRMFLKIALYLHGLLAGICLFQIITTYVLFYSDTTNFIINYTYLAGPTQCLFAFLFIFCLVSVADRYDPTSQAEYKLPLVHYLEPGGIVVVLYLVGLVFSLSTAYADERLTLYSHEPMFMNSTEIGSVELYLFRWQILNLIRGIMSLLGWILIAFMPSKDRMSKIISSNEKYILVL